MTFTRQLQVNESRGEVQFGQLTDEQMQETGILLAGRQVHAPATIPRAASSGIGFTITKSFSTFPRVVLTFHREEVRQQDTFETRRPL